jgi:hypothetical protein
VTLQLHLLTVSVRHRAPAPPGETQHHCLWRGYQPGTSSSVKIECFILLWLDCLAVRQGKAPPADLSLGRFAVKAEDCIPPQETPSVSKGV